MLFILLLDLVASYIIQFVYNPTMSFFSFFKMFHHGYWNTLLECSNVINKLQIWSSVRRTNIYGFVLHPFYVLSLVLSFCYTYFPFLSRSLPPFFFCSGDCRIIAAIDKRGTFFLLLIRFISILRTNDKHVHESNLKKMRVLILIPFLLFFKQL